MVCTIGSKYGRWTVTGSASPAIMGSGKKRSRVTCTCSCGKVKIIHASNLTSGNSTSCGCYRNERISQTCKTHGMTNTPTFKTWQSMLQRCGNPNYKKYSDYGGRGITVCERWLKFENFLEDMGLKPPGLTLERAKNEEGYSAANCIWATPKQQGNNRRSTVVLCVDGVSKPLTSWAEEFGIKRHTLANRIRLGWSHEAAVKTPLKSKD